MITEEIVERRVATMPKATKAQVNGGHHVHLDDPQSSFEVCHRFLYHGPSTTSTSSSSPPNSSQAKL